MLDSTSTAQQACFQFKASFSPCTIMQVTRYDLDQLEQQLAATISRAPNFFIGSALVIDLEAVNNIGLIDFARIKKIIINNNMVPVGVRGGSEEQHAAAVSIGIPVIVAGRSKTTISNSKEKQKTNHLQPSKLITSPIRSGVQVYAKDADLIVVAPVSAGAELLADGNIHVYGPLRGRALAGVQGDTNARIFCRTLEAELVAIAGYYLVKEEMHHLASHDSTVQIYLENEQVKIKMV